MSNAKLIGRYLLFVIGYWSLMIISTHLIVLKLFALDMPALILYIAGMKTKQYTIRNVPEPVDRLVRQQAKKTHKSLNAVLLAALERGVGVANEPVEYHDLDELAGSWVADPDFDAAMEAFESIDEELWK